MKVIGLDLSINSTGVCINDNGKCKYVIITSKMTKKQQTFTHPVISLSNYGKTIIDSHDEYSHKEALKTENIYKIVLYIKKIILVEHPDQCNIEGVSFGSTGSAALIDLTGLNYMVRMMLQELGIPFKIISPTSNKKFAVGNGQADKDVMVASWLGIEKHLRGVKGIKIDDLADAYFLSCYKDEI